MAHGGSIRRTAALAASLLAAAASIAQSTTSNSDSQKNPPPAPRGHFKTPDGKIFAITAEDPADEVINKVIPLKSMSYDAAADFCRPMLSPDGKIAYEKTRNSIFIRDKKSIVDKVMRFIADIDKDTVNISIRIDNIGASGGQSGSLNVDFGQDKGIAIQDGQLKLPDSVDVKIKRENWSGHNNNSMMLTTTSGSPATLWVGKTEPDPIWLDKAFRSKTYSFTCDGKPFILVEGAAPLIMTRIGSSLMIQPSLQDNGLIEVEIYPQVSFLDGKGARKSIKVQSLSTKLTVAENARISIGGVSESKSDAYRNLFGPDFLGGKGSQGILDMFMTAQVLRPAKPPPLPPPSTPTRPRR